MPLHHTHPVSEESQGLLIKMKEMEIELMKTREDAKKLDLIKQDHHIALATIESERAMLREKISERDDVINDLKRTVTLNRNAMDNVTKNLSIKEKEVRILTEELKKNLIDETKTGRDGEEANTSSSANDPLGLIYIYIYLHIYLLLSFLLLYLYICTYIYIFLSICQSIIYLSLYIYVYAYISFIHPSNHSPRLHPLTISRFLTHFL
jgi:hypothetical protein